MSAKMRRNLVKGSALCILLLLLISSAFAFFERNTYVIKKTYGGNSSNSSTSPAGSNTQVQFNDNGAFGADENFTYNGAGTVTLGSQLSLPNAYSTIYSPKGVDYGNFNTINDSQNNIAIGFYNTAQQAGATTIGLVNSALYGGVSIGLLSTAGREGVAIGSGAASEGSDVTIQSVAIGTNARSYGDTSVTIGAYSTQGKPSDQTNSTNSVVIGRSVINYANSSVSTGANFQNDIPFSFNVGFTDIILRATRDEGLFVGTGSITNQNITMDGDDAYIHGSLEVNEELRLDGISSDGTGKVLCLKSDSNIGTCTDAPNSSGVCTCA